jgi:hypothetical protein
MINLIDSIDGINFSSYLLPPERFKIVVSIYPREPLPFVLITTDPARLTAKYNLIS